VLVYGLPHQAGVRVAGGLMSRSVKFHGAARTFLRYSGESGAVAL
jgi:hypothetical protein